jgi:hypothetical protein
MEHDVMSIIVELQQILRSHEFKETLSSRLRTLLINLEIRIVFVFINY